MSVVIETTIGDITVDLFIEERPISCLNFMKLCKLKYYNFNLFHTIEQGFIAQTGDPTGAGDGGSSIWGVVEGHHKRFFEGESLPKMYHTNAGLLSLVGAGKHLVGSQFFFTLGENLTSLDGQHCIIGEVVEGHDVLRKLNEAIVDENFRPYQDIRITHTVILADPFPDPRGFCVPSRSPSPSAERLKNGRIAADEDIDDTEGKSMEEIQEMLAEREAKARATILEIVGDLPDAEMAPPENVLFVCKLNPVTTDDDLEIIFSRFGKVKGCEVIRDRKTGDSLQYAFVEFEEQKSCEAAYFKMDNVLIDDRRIHVDFSQSVSKVKWKGKGRGIEGNTQGLDFNNLRDSGRNKYENSKTDGNVNASRNKRYPEDRHGKSSQTQHRENNERRKAREERHRMQEKQRRKSRSRSRSRQRSNSREKNRNHYTKPDELRRQRKGSRSPPKVKEAYSRQKTYESRSVSRRRERDYSPQRKPYLKKREENYSPARKSEKNHFGKNDTDTGKNESVVNASKKQKRKQTKKKLKRSKRETSSSESSSTSESDSSSETTQSSSDESESSLEEKKRKKKSKKHKHQSKKSKSKKHKK